MINLDLKHWEKSARWQYEAYPFLTSVYMKAALPPQNKYFCHWDDFICRFSDAQVVGYKPNEEMLNIGHLAINELLSGDDNFSIEVEKIYSEIEKAIVICLDARKNNEISDLNSWWLPAEKALSDAASILFNFDYAFDEFLEKLSSENPKDCESLKSNLVEEKPSFLKEAQDEINVLKQKYNDDFEKIYSEFMENFGWFQNSYKGIFAIDKQWLKNYIDEQKEQTETNTQKLLLDEKYTLLKNVACRAISFRDDKKKLLLITAELLEKWLRTICEQKGWKFEEVRWLSIDEVIEAQKNDELVSRAKKYAENNNRIGMMAFSSYDDTPEDFWHSVVKLHTAETSIKEVKGMIANRGIIRGKARIILDAKGDHNFDFGDILVTSMTRPEFLPLMKKASAFVTNEGGITCHAAIVAREMNKPCIIGTKIATQVFKDGDMIEVDANNGIAKVI